MNLNGMHTMTVGTAQKGLNLNGRMLCYAHACMVYMKCFAFVILVPRWKHFASSSN